MNNSYIIYCLNKNDDSIINNQSVLYKSYNIAKECCDALNKAAKEYGNFYYKIEKI